MRRVRRDVVERLEVHHQHHVPRALGRLVRRPPHVAGHHPRQRLQNLVGVRGDLGERLVRRVRVLELRLAPDRYDPPALEKVLLEGDLLGRFKAYASPFLVQLSRLESASMYASTQ